MPKSSEKSKTKSKKADKNKKEKDDEEPLNLGRYKACEKFFKRLAFNLGNSVSQTEVKVISCIPVDVSDLQKRIAELEKELAEKEPRPELASQESENEPEDKTMDIELRNANKPVKKNKSKRQAPDKKTLYPLRSSRHSSSSRQAGNVPRDDPSKKDIKKWQYEAIWPCDDACVSATDIKVPSLRMSEVKQQKSHKKFLKKMKKSMKYKKPKCHYVFYAQTDGPYFNGKDPTSLSRSYLSKMINKQYKPRLLGGDSSQISNFSSPVCKDRLGDKNENLVYETDMCSYCSGEFHNTDVRPPTYDSSCDETFHDVDNQLEASESPQLVDTAREYRANNISTESRFYDSTLYDVVPVKEKPVKAKKTLDSIANSRDALASVDIMYWPENMRTKLFNHPMYNSYYFDYQNGFARADKVLKRSPRMKRKEVIAKYVPKRKNTINRQIEMSKSSCIDFGEVYPKLVRKREDKYLYPTRKCLMSTQAPSKVDAECLTTAKNSCECQTLPSEIAADAPISITDNKTEITMNQIKSILQSVLHEVKINTFSKDSPKKDAIVQNGLSQGTMPETLQTNIPNNIGVSRLKNSIFYNPYEVPPYMPSCSKQMYPGHYYYPQSSLKKFQNYPLLVQNSGPSCSNCYRHHMKCHCEKQPKTTATNTDSMKPEQGLVTEKLIKEIYKTIALNMGAIKKENSNDYEPLHDLSRYVKNIDEQPLKELKKTMNVVHTVSELYRTNDIQTSSDSRIISDSKSKTYDTTETPGNHSMVTDSRPQSSGASTDVNMNLRSDRIEKFLNETKSELFEESTQEKSSFNSATQSTITDVYALDTLRDTYASFIPEQSTQVKEKRSILSKMIRSVKLFKSKEKKARKKIPTKVKEPVTAQHLSDSDDYQTVYSQETDANRKNKARACNLAKRKIKHISQREKSPEKSPEKTARKPYMDQEYQRQWNNKMLFYYNRWPQHRPFAIHYPAKGKETSNAQKIMFKLQKKSNNE